MIRKVLDKTNHPIQNINRAVVDVWKMDKLFNSTLYSGSNYLFTYLGKDCMHFALFSIIFFLHCYSILRHQGMWTMGILLMLQTIPKPAIVIHTDGSFA